jgi:hypothetical protein
MFLPKGNKFNKFLLKLLLKCYTFVVCKQMNIHFNTEAMRKICTFLLISALFPLLVNAQTLTPFIVASSGGFSANASGSLSFTVGEMTMVQTFQSANNFLTQGFQQPEDLFVGITETPLVSGAPVVYPNPTSGLFSLQYKGTEASEKVISIYNSLGQLVKTQVVQQIIGANRFDLDMSAFAQGMYVIELKLRNASGNLMPVISKLNLLK